MKPNIGISDFAEIRTGNYYYVDKTHMLGRLINSGSKVILFTRPRRFGKTLNMSMIQRFFDCNYDPGARMTPADNRRLFEGLSVCQDAEAMYEQGKYPVIFMSLKDMEFTTWEEFKLRFQEMLVLLASNYLYLLDSAKLNSVEKKIFSKLVDDTSAFESLGNFLRFVSSILKKYHGVPAILLIDEYDAPIQGAYAHGYYDEMITFMRSFLSAGLKDNPALKFACLTGVMRVAKESIFSGLNNLTVDTVLSEDFADCFGFTQQEVDNMAKYLGFESKLPEIKAWYDGYLFGNKEIYNPWSVLNYFKYRCKAQAYWVSTSSNGVVAEVLQKADDAREQLLGLLDGKAVKAEVETDISYRELTGETNSIFSFLLMTGYLKPQEELEDGYYLLTIP
ncbi:MAG: AAA family ATPase, partial [bacterium]|nr:AAA family ATPase [bacterium]